SPRAGCLWLVYATARRRTIPGGHACLCFGPDEQGAGDYVPVCSSAAGLLALVSSCAAGRSWRRTGRRSRPRPLFLESDLGEVALACNVGRERDHHDEGGEGRNPGEPPALDPLGECGYLLCQISREGLLAGRSGTSISASRACAQHPRGRAFGTRTH